MKLRRNKESYTPAINTPERVLFEQAYQDDNKLLLASLELDEIIARKTIHTTEDGIYIPSIEQVSSFGREVDLHAYRSTQLTRELANKSNHTDWFRLMGHFLTHDARSLTETAFIIKDRHDMRRELVDGLHGLHVTLLELAEKEYRANIKDLSGDLEPTIREARWQDVRELKGVIADQGVLALINYDQNPNRFAVMSSTKEDMFDRTDGWYYYTAKHPAIGWKLPFQTKFSRVDTTGRPLDLEKITPEQGVTLFYSDYDTKDRQLTPLLIRNNDGEALTDYEINVILEAKNHLQEDIARYIETTPGIELPYVPADDETVRHVDDLQNKSAS